MPRPDAEEMVQIIRGLKQRIADLETRSQQEREITKIRSVTDTGLGADSVTVTSNSNPLMNWDGTATSDEWDIGEWD